MKRIAVTVGSAVLIGLGVLLFPFALWALSLVIAGDSRASTVVAIDAVLLVVGAIGVVGLWDRRSD